MKLFGSTKTDVDQDKDGEHVTKLESVEVVLVHCSLVNGSYQQVTKVLFTFVSNKQFGQLINTSPHSLSMLNKTSAEVWFIDQKSKQLQKKYNVNITLITR